MLQNKGTNHEKVTRREYKALERIFDESKAVFNGDFRICGPEQIINDLFVLVGESVRFIERLVERGFLKPDHVTSKEPNGEEVVCYCVLAERILDYVHEVEVIDIPDEDGLIAKVVESRKTAEELRTKKGNLKRQLDAVESALVEASRQQLRVEADLRRLRNLVR